MINIANSSKFNFSIQISKQEFSRLSLASSLTSYDKHRKSVFDKVKVKKPVELSYFFLDGGGKGNLTFDSWEDLEKTKMLFVPRYRIRKLQRRHKRDPKVQEVEENFDENLNL